MLPETFTPEFLRQLELVKIRSRRAFLGTRQGGHASPKRGHGIEFADYRQYELGDNPRHIDWGVYARSERLYLKKYQEEQDLNIYLILDASPSMFLPEGEAKWETARDITLALAYVGLMEQDSVTSIVPGQLITPAYFGAKAIHQLSQSLLSIRSKPGDFFSSFKKSVGRLRFPGVAIVLSDFLMPLQETIEFFNILRARNLDITAIRILSPSELKPLQGYQSARVVDCESGEEVEIALSVEARAEYEALLEEHSKRLQDFLASCQVDFVQVLSSRPLSEFVIDNLSRTGLLK